jgi:hypothetical protein
LLTHGLIDLSIEVFSMFMRTGGSSFCDEMDQLLDVTPLEKSQHGVFRSDNDLLCLIVFPTPLDCDQAACFAVVKTPGSNILS